MTQERKQQVQLLLSRYVSGEISNIEEKRLFGLLASEAEPQEWEDIIEELMMAENLAPDYDKNQWQPVIESILNREVVTGGRIRTIKAWMKYVAAASVILMLGAGAYFAFFKKNMPTEVAVNPTTSNDIVAPATSRATITLVNGQKIYLDSAANGQLTVQENVKLVKLANGQIAYQNADGTVSNELKYNTLDNPRGSRVINMQLADGSRVWLNAGSSVTYPIAFVGNERKVSVTGEAYFEIAHDASKPFKVDKGDIEVTVLGTHFNVSAYDDEDNIKVTLLQGSVKVANAKGTTTIKPGQQALLTFNEKPDVRNDVDLEGVMAWKNGLFNFDGVNLKEVMSQLKNWYDIEIAYAKGIPDIELGGKMSRNEKLPEVLKGLRGAGVNFKMEGKKLIVFP